MSNLNEPAVDHDEEQALARSALSFPVVGIGASAGGLPAIAILLENLPADTGMAYAIVLHFAPDSPSMATTIFQRSTRMPVREVSDDLPIEANHVYVVPPGHSLSMNNGHLRLSRLDRTSPQHTAIDLFFRSLADMHRERAIAIVLSGAGADGSQGLRHLKERGGISLVQSPADAEHESMPLNAIAAGAADFVLPVADMAQKLVDLWANARRIELPSPPIGLQTKPSPTAESEHDAENAIQAMLALLRERTGHDFSQYKRATVMRRLERRMQVSRQPTVPAYVAFLQANQQETTQLLQDMLISVTNFFRDRQAFEALERTVISEMFESRAPVERVRTWVVGCATGEEAYSVAMLLLEHASNAKALTGVQVFATDIDEKALGVGRGGMYSESIEADVPPVRLRQFFDRQPGQYVVAKGLRERVTFSVHNVLRDPPFSRLDLVCCRNLLIYLDRTAQRQLLETFHFALRPGGLLFLGSAETADAAPEHFTIVDRKNRIYRASATNVERRVPSALSDPLGFLLPAVPHLPQRRQLIDDIRAQLEAETEAPAVVVDHQLKIVLLSGQANRFLHLQTGEMSAHVLHLVVPELRLALRAAVAHAQQTSESVQARRVRLQRGKVATRVSITVRPLRQAQHAQAAKGWLVVLFEESELTPDDDVLTAEEVALEAAGTLADLNAQLSAAIGESDSSTEALRASNEELQSVNEELRSTSEELETSKEELQSVNEELTTVNFDMKHHLEVSAKANDDLQNFIAASEIAIAFVDRGMRLQRFTPRAAGIFNLLSTDLNRSLFDITHRLDYPEMESDAHAAFKSLQPIEREVASNDGHWYLARVLPYRSSDDRIEGVVLSFIDITARHAAEETVREGEERLTLLFDSSVDYVIIMLDEQGLITRWNKGAESVLGYEEAEVLGQSCDLIFTPEDRAAGVPEGERRSALKSGRAQDRRWHLSKNGSRVFFNGVLVRLAKGAEKGYAKIARDMTQSRLAEQQRDELLASEQSLRSQLQRAGALKDEFLAVMSHELKNPLNLIALNAQLLASDPDAQRSQTLSRIARTISASVRSQAQLIDDLLDLSRAQTGKLTLHLEELDFKEIGERIVNAVTPDARAQGIALTLRSDAADYTMRADPVRIEQIVWNLVSNALKFTSRGGCVNVTLTADETSIRFEVADTGQGIDPQFLPLIFDMFQQADGRSTTRSKSGLGIGLALVQRLAQAHGGQAMADSAGAGQGATFTVLLPRQGVLRGPDKAPAPVMALDGLRILIVEDEPDALDMFSTLLRLRGATVTSAANAAQALAHTSPGAFDLVVSDIAMPGMDGYALLRRLREAGLESVPAIALTGFARPGDRKLALDAGFNEHLGKPLQFEAFMSAISRLGVRRQT